MARAGKNQTAKLSKTTAKYDGPHPVDVHVGARLKLRRMMLGISQEALGNSLGLTFQQIQKYEKGANRIGASRIFELATLLEVPIQYFYDDFSGAPSAAPVGSFDGAGDAFMALINSPEGMELCRCFAGINDNKVKKRVLELVKTIADTEDLTVT